MPNLLKLKEKLGESLYGERKDVLRLRDVRLFESFLRALSEEAVRSRVEEESLSLLRRLIQLRSMADPEVESVAERLIGVLFEFFEREELFFTIDVEFYGPHSILKLPLTERDRCFYRARLKAFDFRIGTVALKIEQSFRDLEETYSESKRSLIVLRLLSEAKREAERAFGEAFQLFRRKDVIVFSFFLKKIELGLDGMYFPSDRRRMVSFSEVANWVSLSEVSRRPAFQREFGIFLAPWLVEKPQKGMRLSLGRDPDHDWALLFLLSKKPKDVEKVRQAVSAISERTSLQDLLQTLDQRSPLFQQIVKAFPEETWPLLCKKSRRKRSQSQIL